MIRVGLVLSLRDMWQGGANYFHNLLSCYKRYPDEAVKVVVFSRYLEDVACYGSDAVEVHAFPEQRMSRGPTGWLRRAATKMLRYDPVLLSNMERHRIDLLSHYGVGSQKSMNTLHWEPDFQYKVLPKLFSPEESAGRDSKVADVRLWGNILLSSRAAACDFRRYYPELSSVQTRVLPFSGASVLNVIPLTRSELETQYPVREPYFFLPNQFWQHKNHAVVVEALRQTRSAIRVVCTGLMEDRRNIEYVPTLLDKVKQVGLENRFLCLGAVSYRVVVSLMHHSLAVLQPSLFEGWSTSVEEAKAMRKQIILSDIDVHLEQAPERGVYFSPKSPSALAACMTRVHAELDATTEQGYAELRAERKAGSERAWIENFVRIVKAVSEA